MAWSTPRTWTAGEIPTAAIFNAHVRDNLLALQDRIQEVIKSADETVTNSAALQDDNELQFTAVAGQKYDFTFTLSLTSSTLAADIAVALTFPAGTMIWTGIGLDTAATSSIANVRIAGASGSGTSLNFGVTTASAGLIISGSFICTTSGTVKLQWAQATAGGDTTVKQGSKVQAIRAAA